MNVFGIGSLEMVVILLVAFIALGPGKTMDVARTIGKVVREARRTFADVMDAASISDEDINTRRNPEPQRPADTPVTPPTDPLPAPPHLQELSADPPADATQPDTDRRIT